MVRNAPLGLAGWSGLLGHANSPDAFSVLSIYSARVLCLLSSSERLGALHWWQRKASPILKGMYPDFPRLRDKPYWHGRTYATDGRLVMIPNRRVDVGVHLRHLSQSRVLQKSY
ncbi:expressed protein [Echinococcus multilocularis]|uniref:Expressed protein n=1 Tax=Echinococcus multilocularis TaxID=6211 RepID=A0A068YIX2_ECHMU|nr:expressed protein [Echinococcus multilocularis]